MSTFPFTAVVGSDDMALALTLSAVSPRIGGVLVRGEKGTAKSTLVRALADVLPPQRVVIGCRFACSPDAPDPTCPDAERHTQDAETRRPRLVELPVGAGEDRLTGSLDLSAALAQSRTAFEPGLLAAANRGMLYVDEVNLLPDHLVDVLLDAAAMGRNTVEREGVSVSHAAQIVLVGTMNPEEGELRPQLLDRFGLTVEVAASRDPGVRAQVVRRRLAFDDDPAALLAEYADEQAALEERLARAQRALDDVTLSDTALDAIAHVCAGFDVDGMRADIVTARTAAAHAAWCGRTDVRREDVRVAALFALPHRRRRNPFDAPGIDIDTLERLLDECNFDDTPPEGPDTPPGGPNTPDGGSGDDDPGSAGTGHDGPGDGGPGADDSAGPAAPPASGTEEDSSPTVPASDTTTDPQAPRPDEQTPSDSSQPNASGAESDGAREGEAKAGAPTGVAQVGQAFRAREFTVRGIGSGGDGKRSRAMTERGRTIGARRGDHGPVHLPATLRAAALARRAPSRQHVAMATDAATGPEQHLRIVGSDVRRQVNLGREANLVLFVVDASGSMAARKRMTEVKTAVMSLLLDAYRRRDQVGLITFRGRDAELVLPPTGSVDTAAARLQDVGHGGRTPLAEGLELAAQTLTTAARRDARRRPLVVLVTDGRATAGPDALTRARAIADAWPHAGWQTLVLDSESGRMKLGLAADLAHRMGAEYVPLGEVAAHDLRTHVERATAPMRTSDEAGLVIQGRADGRITHDIRRSA